MACSLVDTLGSYLALVLSHVAAVADPVAFVIGGGVSKAGPILIDAIERHYNDNILPALRGKVFRLAELGNDAGIFGAARMTLEERSAGFDDYERAEHTNCGAVSGARRMPL